MERFCGSYIFPLRRHYEAAEFAYVGGAVWVFFLILAVWLQDKFGLGLWIVVVLGIVGLLTSVSTARSCLKSLRKAADESSSHKDPPVSFNDHK